MKKIIFTDSLLLDYLDDEDFQLLREKVLEELKKAEQSNNGRYLSNRGGFQTYDLDHKKNKEIIEIAIKNTLQIIKKNYFFKKIQIKIDNIWINKNPKMAVNLPHIHPRSNFSGVIYIRVPEQDGELVFYRGDKASCMMGEQIFTNKDFASSCNVKPEEQMIVLFPSHFEHMVHPHFQDINRISISFNIRVENATNIEDKKDFDD